MVATSSVRIFIVAVIAALAANADAQTDIPSYKVPSVDFSRLFGSSNQLVDAMQHEGILSLKNIPQYAELRREFLAKAAACAVHAKDDGAEFLLHRRLRDGTQRYTISTDAGKHLDKSGFETVEACPGYQQVYQRFSRVVEDAVASVGRAIDASKALQISRRQLHKTNTARMTAHELMSESVHLDHFHAYEASRSLDGVKTKTLAELSLEMHTDNGLMIAMAAPEYFDVKPSGEVASRHTRSEDAGLLIKAANGKVVRPLLQADELVLMLGEGINTWIHTTPRLHAVTHGMQFPRGLSYAEDSHKAVRAWFGKMILLSEDHVMANTGMTYGEFANQTTRYLKDAANERGFAAIACSPHRKLQASDNSCTVRTCTLKTGGDASTMTDSCQITCNHQSATDEALCEANCDCEETNEAGNKCWMLCVPLISTDECNGEQKCNSAFKKDEIAMQCAAGVSPTTAPTTTAPTTTAPTTTEPVSASAASSAIKSASGSTGGSSATTLTYAPSTSASQSGSDAESPSGSASSFDDLDVGSKDASASQSSAAGSPLLGSVVAFGVAAIASLIL